MQPDWSFQHIFACCFSWLRERSCSGYRWSNMAEEVDGWIINDCHFPGPLSRPWWGPHQRRFFKYDYHRTVKFNSHGGYFIVLSFSGFLEVDPYLPSQEKSGGYLRTCIKHKPHTGDRISNRYLFRWCSKSPKWDIYIILYWVVSRDSPFLDYCNLQYIG